MVEEFKLLFCDVSPMSATEKDLEVIYQAYPRKVGRRRAMLEIDRALRRITAGEIGDRLPPERAVEELLKATALYAQSPSGNRGNFTPHPATWFHQSRYLDNPDEWFHQTEQERMRALNNVGVSTWSPP